MAKKREKRTETAGRSAKKSTAGVPSTGRKAQSTQRSKASASARNTKREQSASKRDSGTAAKPRGVVRRAAASVGRALSRVTGGGRKASTRAAASNKAVAPSAPRTPERVPKRQADIPMDQIAATYTPTQTSLKGPFRASGADHQRDQEFANGAADERWNDEDRMTNKSGDPRIGTHGRSYEPGEARAASGRKRNA